MSADHVYPVDMSTDRSNSSAFFLKSLNFEHSSDDGGEAARCVLCTFILAYVMHLMHVAAEFCDPRRPCHAWPEPRGYTVLVRETGFD